MGSSELVGDGRSVSGRLVAAISARPWLQAMLLAGLALVVLSPVLQAEFIWDDFRQIVESPTVGDWSQVPRFFTSNVMQAAGQQGRNAEGVDLYRPLFMVALTAIHTINGADSFWYHLACLLVHITVCLVLWRLARGWLESAAAAAVVFVLVAFHPVTAEAYLWASSISETMAALGLLVAALLLDSGCRQGHTTSSRWCFAALAGLSLLAGLLSKEVVLAALPVITLWLWLGRRISLRYHLPMWGAAALFLVLRVAALGGMKAAGATLEQRLLALRNLPVLLLDGVRAMLAMHPIGPRHLSYDYQSVTWTWSILAGVVVLALAAGAWQVRRSSPLLLTACAVTGSMLLPAVMVTTVPGWGGFARYLYLPWAVLALALTQVGLALYRWLVAQRRHLVPVALLALAGYAAAQQLGLRQALYAYSSQEGLARTSIAIAPQVPEGYEWLGNVYLARGDLRQALQYYQEAMQRAPQLYRPRNNVAASLVQLGQPARALSHLAILEQQHGITTRSSISTIQALLQLRRWDEAGERLLWIMRREPQHPTLRELQQQLLRVHPDPHRYRSWLRERLAQPEYQELLPSLQPLLESTPG